MGIYNGCGGEGGMSFSKIVRHNLKLLPKYDQDKGLLFWEGVEEEICKPHDRRFYIGGGLLAYLYANSIFAYHFTIKLWWTNVILQLLAFPILFIGINLGGIKYFHWCF